MNARTAGILRRGALVPLCSALILGCGSEPEKPPAAAPAKPKIAPARRPLAPATPTALQEATPAAVLGKMRSRLRLTPDARFLAAVARVDRFATNAGMVPVVRFGEGSWHVQIGPGVIAVLPELPTFADQYAMVLGRAARAWKQIHPNAEPAAADEVAPRAADDAPAAAGGEGGTAGSTRDAGAAAEPAAAAPPPLDELAPLPVEEAVAALQAIDKRWSQGERSADDARRAAQAHVALCLGMIDELDLGDALYAQALAAVALAEAASGQPMAREKALLAHRMGHTQHAATIAQTLPADHPARQFAAGDAAALVARTKDAAVDGFTRMLALRALMRGAPGSEVDAHLARAPDALRGSFPALSAAADRVWGIEGDQRMAYSALIAMRRALGRPVELPADLAYGAFGLRESASVPAVAAALGVPPEQLLGEGELLLGALAEKAGGPWLPADALAAYHRAHLLHALDEMVRFYVDSLGAPEPAKPVVALLQAGKGPLAQQWTRYAKDVVRAEQRSLPLDELVKDIRELRDLGIGAVRRLSPPIDERSALGNAQQDAASAIVERCDTRIECRVLLSHIAHYNLQDLVSDEVLRATVVSEAPQANGSTRLRHVRMQNDRAAFLAAMADRSLTPALRASFLADRSAWLDAADVRRAFDALTAEAPAHHGVSNAYAGWLIEQKDHVHALRVIDAWLRLQRSEDPLQPIAARTTRARALQRAGKLKEAWAEAEPLLASMHGGAMMRAAQVKSAAGEAAEAVALAQRTLERYPNPTSVGLLAQLLWKADRSEEAAALIEEWSNRLTIGDFAGPLGDAFAEAYADRPADDGAKAFSALLAKKVDKQGMRTLIKTDRLPPELAFRSYSQIQGAGAERHHDAARSYLLFKAWKGEAAAREWIEQALPVEERDPISEHAYTAGAYELVWDFVADPAPDHPNRSFIWLMRTASLLRSAAPPAQWRPRLDRYYAKNRQELRDRMALHLLGEMDQIAVWSATKTTEERAECAYVFGLKAQLDGDVAQAVDWYRVTREGGRGDAGEVRWSIDALHALRASYKSLAVLTEEARAKRAEREGPPGAQAPDADAAPQRPVGMPATNPPPKP